MATNCFDDMVRRGFFYQLTDEAASRKAINESKITFYVGFDPTADSLHIGHIIPVMAARRLQQFGHKPIMLVGGATGLVGDPTGKTESRPVLPKETVARNATALKAQLGKFIKIEDSIFVNNADWFEGMLYIDMLRDVGRHFSINKMLSMESVKQRLEAGMSFLEFNYMILQAYDFLHLNRTYDCRLQIGGQDQWGNIVSGVELVRRSDSKEVFGITFPLLLDSSGQKFGKSVGGAVWLDSNKTSVFDYYQFWRNVSDEDVIKLLYLFTSLPTEEIDCYKNLTGNGINRLKEILAYEATVLAHGPEEAAKAYLSAGTKFGFADPENKLETSSCIKNIKPSECSDNLPSFEVSKSDLEKGIWIISMLVNSGLCSSNGEARRLVSGGGAYLNGNKIQDANYNLTLNDISNGEAILKAGKKNIRRIILK